MPFDSDTQRRAFFAQNGNNKVNSNSIKGGSIKSKNNTQRTKFVIPEYSPKIKVFFGDNGKQDFWEAKSEVLLLMKNKGDDFWYAEYGKKLVEDESVPKKEGTTNLLTGKTAEILATKLLMQDGIKVDFDLSHKFKDWGNESRMRLVQTSVSNKDTQELIGNVYDNYTDNQKAKILKKINEDNFRERIDLESPFILSHKYKNFEKLPKGQQDIIIKHVEDKWNKLSEYTRLFLLSNLTYKIGGTLDNKWKEMEFKKLPKKVQKAYTDDVFIYDSGQRRF